MELQDASFHVNFGLSPSSESFPGRDGFGFALRDSNDNNLFTISLVPVDSALNDAYQVRYTVGANPVLNALDNLGQQMFIYLAGYYTLNFDFIPGGADPTFSATVIGSNTKTFTGIASGMGSLNVARVGAEWNTLNSPAGSNALIFDNISLVPEPSSTLLAGLAALGLLRRRRTC
jgi:hypothetical protein